MNQDKLLKVSEINSLSPIQLVDHPGVTGKFVKLYNDVHGDGKGELMLARQKFHFLKQINETPALKECTGISLYGVFMDCAVYNYSLETGNQPDVYLMSRNVNVGTKDQPQWIKNAVMVVSPYGELKTRIQAGQIKYADNPVVVYQGDNFSIDNGIVNHSPAVPRLSKEIIASYIKIVRPDGSVDYKWLLKEDWERMAGYSAKQNKSNGANSLYKSANGGIDPGFLMAKTIKHAFKTYPKVKLGQFSEAQVTDAPLADGNNIPENIDYGFTEDITHTEVEPEVTAGATTTATAQEDDSF
jgi:hypothetical protein